MSITLEPKLKADYDHAKKNGIPFTETTSFAEAIAIMGLGPSSDNDKLHDLLYPWLTVPHLGNVSSFKYQDSSFPRYTHLKGDVKVTQVFATRLEDIDSNVTLNAVIIPGKDVNNTIYKINIEDHNDPTGVAKFSVTVLNDIPLLEDTIGLFKPGEDGVINFELNRLGKTFQGTGVTHPIT